MVNLSVKIENIDELRANLRKSPKIVKKWMNRAIEASIFEIEKRADDSGDSKLFQFRTPRALRTGFLALSFKLGIRLRDFYGEIGPTAEYAPFVHKSNRFMPRIARNSQRDIQTHFDDAIENIVKDIAKT